ncbi:YtxH domain-containing protein [Sphingobacterium detergens]|uniref:Gas vesicle protein n=1 Tax=Sphingobacterium detergens TaxID=1145106 RepID=A0A420AYJ0_SPHD1|nr:YtxH domain-containing protein [Sphingobacterium detergens]RKE49594.1 gas vesicle protein [Sphingobacterium detergens]
MNDTSKVALALLAGLAAGAALGVLFAPDKGSDTRDKINDSLSDLSDAIRERAEEQFDQLNDFKEKIVSTLKGKINQVEEIVDDDIIEHA